MKKLFYLVVTLLMISCSEQLLVDEVVGESVEQTAVSELNVLMEKARWGNGEAYVKLADCYRNGKGVKQDLTGMLSMVFLADEYGGIKRMEDYISSLPAESDYKLVFDAMEKFSKGEQDDALTMAEELIKQSNIEGYTVKGIIQTEQGSIEEGKSLLEIAVEKGSSLAELYLCISDWHHGKSPNVRRLATMTNKMPIANACLGKIYSGRNGEAMKNEELAAYYYMKADEKACLSRNGARWLLNYYRNGGNLKLSEKDIERLKILAGTFTVETCCH